MNTSSSSSSNDNGEYIRGVLCRIIVMVCLAPLVSAFMRFPGTIETFVLGIVIGIVALSLLVRSLKCFRRGTPPETEHVETALEPDVDTDDIPPPIIILTSLSTRTRDEDVPKSGPRDSPPRYEAPPSYDQLQFLNIENEVETPSSSVELTDDNVNLILNPNSLNRKTKILQTLSKNDISQSDNIVPSSYNSHNCSTFIPSSSSTNSFQTTPVMTNYVHASAIHKQKFLLKDQLIESSIKPI